MQVIIARHIPINLAAVFSQREQNATVTIDEIFYVIFIEFGFTNIYTNTIFFKKKISQ